ncbi:hypothetical protein VNI00_015548 [Paramarasmius palmivorus]|uniref:Uncharacterized protein n=1 Tax=Paramarasmius palmivorus TaxID=297713 RepID=A0AAW0BJL9_9AGAR
MCSRHEICEPNGVVDLNRGEKFLLGDYALGASQRLSSPLLKRVLSYDIACQYCKKFFQRMRLLPNEASIEIKEKNWSFVVPKLHIRGHERPCQETYALHLHPGAGQTDGEGIERLWAEVGPIGVSTREMGPGHRRDTIDDHQGARNWRKICGLGHLLRRREAEARRQVLIQTREYERFCGSQSEIRLLEWRKIVMAWESGSSALNPYSLSEQGETEEDVRLRMATLEAECSMRGEPVLHEVAPSAFLWLGLDIEDQQRRMAITMGEKDGGSARQKTGNVEKRAKLGRLIARFRSLQQIYIPSALTYLLTLPNYSNVDSVEKIPVLLPLGLPESLRSLPIMKEWVERGESRRELSWIWSGVDVTGDSKAMQEALRIEWSKSWARKRRWDEELDLIIEEKRRVIASLTYDAEKWLERAEHQEQSPEGYLAYAYRQAALRKGLIERFEALWRMPIRQHQRAKKSVEPVKDARDGDDSEAVSEEENEEDIRMSIDDDDEDEDD